MYPTQKHHFFTHICPLIQGLVMEGPRLFQQPLPLLIQGVSNTVHLTVRQVRHADDASWGCTHHVLVAYV